MASMTETEDLFQATAASTALSKLWGGGKRGGGGEEGGQGGKKKKGLGEV